MQRIRHATKKHRKVLLAAVIILTVGLVGSFAVWNSDGYNKDNGSEMTVDQQIAMYEDYLAGNEPAEGAAVDYNTASSMAEVYMSLRSLYYRAYSGVAATDSAAGLQYYNKSVEAAGKAADYYQKQLEAAPENLNDFGKAQIIADKAQALAFAGSNDEAQTLFDQALALAPDSYDVASKYLDFVYINQGIAAARTYADSYKSLVGEISEYYSQMEQVIAYYEMLDQIQNTTTEVQQESDAAGGGDNAASDSSTGDSQ